MHSHSPIATPTHTLTLPSISPIEIGANRCRVHLLHTTKVWYMLRDSISAFISMLEAPQNPQLMTRTTMPSMMIMTITGVGEFLLSSGAMALSWGGLTQKEGRNGGHRRAREVERDGGTKIGTPTANQDSSDYTLLGAKRGPWALRRPPQLWPYNGLPTHCHPPCRNPTLACLTASSHSMHPRDMHPPLFGLGNTTLLCTTIPDALVAWRRYPMPTLNPFAL